MRAHLFLYEEVDPTREDLVSVAQWLHAEPDQIEVHIKHEPIDKFLGQIKEMHGTFNEFPKDERRTNKILRLLKQGATPMPMYVEQGDPDLFVMEGRHRMVAFWLAGMKTVPVAYASKKFVAEDSYQPPELHTGDKILKGKFKNSPAEIKGFGKDKHNQPVLKTNKGDIQLFKPRVVKLIPDKLDEYEGSIIPTENSKAIFAKLQQLGYEKLGSGQDATVWAKDDNHVIKILMPRRTLPSDVTNAEKGFMTFYEFCKKHPELPNLPRFIDIGGQGTTVFEINGTPYRQIAMERLLPIPDKSFEQRIVWLLSDLAKIRAPWSNVVSMLKKPGTWPPGWQEMPQLIAERFADPVVSKQFGILYLTMSRLYHAGLKSGLGWDLHTENAMLRRDGTIVIVDPYFT